MLLLYFQFKFYEHVQKYSPKLVTNFIQIQYKGKFNKLSIFETYHERNNGNLQYFTQMCEILSLHSNVNEDLSLQECFQGTLVTIYQLTLSIITEDLHLHSTDFLCIFSN